MKKCKKCNEVKSFSEFAKDKSRKDGHRSSCKVCNKAYYEANKEKIRQSHKAYYEANKEKINRRKVDCTRKCLVENSFFRLSHNIRSRIRTALSRQGFSKNTKTAEILGCSYEELRAHLIQTLVHDIIRLCIPGDNHYLEACFFNTFPVRQKRCIFILTTYLRGYCK